MKDRSTHILRKRGIRETDQKKRETIEQDPEADKSSGGKGEETWNLNDLRQPDLRPRRFGSVRMPLKLDGYPSRVISTAV